MGFGLRDLRLRLEHRWRLSIAQASLALHSAYAIFDILIQNIDYKRVTKYIFFHLLFRIFLQAVSGLPNPSLL